MNFMQGFCKAPLIPLTLNDFIVYANESDQIKLKKHGMGSPFTKDIYSTIVSVLRSPLLEWDSSTKPIIDNKYNNGVIFLYTAYKSYTDDNISWRSGNQMIKTILYDKVNGKWKIKNGSDKEKNFMPILRRKTSIEESLDMSDEHSSKDEVIWYKHEYKLWEEEDNGKKKVREWPVLIHYFKKTKKRNSTTTTKPISYQPMTTTVYSHAPDHAFLGTKFKMIIVVQTLQNNQNNQQFYLNFDEIPFPARKICSEKTRVTLEVEISNEYNISAGIYFLSVNCVRENLSEVSNEWAFFVLPQNKQISLPLSFGKLHCLDTNWLKNFHWSLNSMDISDNKISDLLFLEGFDTLLEVVCNNNKLGDKTKFPYMPNLRCLHLCKNEFTNLDLLVDKLSTCFPSLELLSLTGNELCPWDPFQNRTYRIQILSKIRSLKQLDCKTVSNEERSQNFYNSNSAIVHENKVNSANSFPFQTQSPNTQHFNQTQFSNQNNFGNTFSNFNTPFNHSPKNNPSQNIFPNFNNFNSHQQQFSNFNSNFNSNTTTSFPSFSEFFDNQDPNNPEDFEFLDWKFSPDNNYFQNEN